MIGRAVQLAAGKPRRHSVARATAFLQKSLLLPRGGQSLARRMDEARIAEAPRSSLYTYIRYATSSWTLDVALQERRRRAMLAAAAAPQGRESCSPQCRRHSRLQKSSDDFRAPVRYRVQEGTATGLAIDARRPEGSAEEEPHDVREAPLRGGLQGFVVARVSARSGSEENPQDVDPTGAGRFRDEQAVLVSRRRAGGEERLNESGVASPRRGQEGRAVSDGARG